MIKFFLSSEIKKIPLVLLKKIRKTPTQIKIIEKQNLANIENLKLQSKRLLQKKRVSLLPKISDTAKQSVAVLTKKNKVKSKKQKFLYLKYKNLQKFKREQVLRKIKKRKSIFGKIYIITWALLIYVLVILIAPEVKDIGDIKLKEGEKCDVFLTM